MIQKVLDKVYDQLRPLRDGRIADYIPELSKANPDHFAISIVTTDGTIFEADGGTGDARKEITLQSVSKPFIYALALEDHGHERVHEKVGVEPTGQAFNSIIELEEKSHLPFNPMINSGAIATTSLIKGRDSTEKLHRILDLFSKLAGRTLHVDLPVFMSERSTGHRNRAIAYLMRHFGVLGDDIEATLELYFQQCSILANTRDLAFLAATLAGGGVQPMTRERVIDANHVRDVLALMFTCGMYDSAGEWAYSVGLPAKSGVSGGLIAVVPGRMGIAVSSPLLDSQGHSVRGVRVLQNLSREWRLSVFDQESLQNSSNLAGTGEAS
jgi:glutaminase